MTALECDWDLRRRSHLELSTRIFRLTAVRLLVLLVLARSLQAAVARDFRRVELAELDKTRWGTRSLSVEAGFMFLRDGLCGAALPKLGDFYE